MRFFQRNPTNLAAMNSNSVDKNLTTAPAVKKTEKEEEEEKHEEEERRRGEWEQWKIVGVISNGTLISLSSFNVIRQPERRRRRRWRRRRRRRRTRRGRRRRSAIIRIRREWRIKVGVKLKDKKKLKNINPVPFLNSLRWERDSYI